MNMNPDDPFPDLVESVCVNVCGREDMGDDAPFVAWLRKLLTKKLASAQAEHAAWRERAEAAEQQLAAARVDGEALAAAFRVTDDAVASMHELVQKARQHFSNGGMLRGNGKWRQSEISVCLMEVDQHFKAVVAAHTELEAARAAALLSRADQAAGN